VAKDKMMACSFFRLAKILSIQIRDATPVADHSPPEERKILGAVFCIYNSQKNGWKLSLLALLSDVFSANLPSIENVHVGKE